MLRVALLLCMLLASASRIANNSGAKEPRPHASRGQLPAEHATHAPMPSAVPQQATGRSWECVVLVAFLLGGFVHGVAGFGAGIVSMSIVPAVVPVMDAAPIVAVFALIICAGLALQLRDALGGPHLRPVLLSLFLGCLAGVPLGGLLLTKADPRWLQIGLGTCMLVSVLLSHGRQQLYTPQGGSVCLTMAVQSSWLLVGLAANPHRRPTAFAWLRRFGCVPVVHAVASRKGVEGC